MQATGGQGGSKRRTEIQTSPRSAEATMMTMMDDDDDDDEEQGGRREEEGRRQAKKETEPSPRGEEKNKILTQRFNFCSKNKCAAKK